MLVILDYGMGNLRSVLRRVEKLGHKALLTSDPAELEKASKIIMPGVGAFNSGMSNLETRGLLPTLNRKVLQEKTPILGICLGMQMMCRWGEEGDIAGLGWIDADCVRFNFEDKQGGYLRIPHMGWNTVEQKGDCLLFDKVDQSTRFYFVHSYYVKPHAETLIAGTTDYGVEFASAIHQGNIYGTQFHPEKSHQAGANMIQAFLAQA
ncbi:MAG: imidazole glycerol phosphate synthase subunit HisH [Anaerolineales bacterium]|nr:imidazole glycerol phosphate synthase subunit HisH [Anaerolineales bacterium]